MELKLTLLIVFAVDIVLSGKCPSQEFISPCKCYQVSSN